MPSLTLDLAREGAVVTMHIGVSRPRRDALIAAQLPIPNPVPIRVMIDTGAYVTCIDPAHLAPLGITPSGVCDVLTPSTGSMPVRLNQFDVGITILLSNEKTHLLPTLPVIESDLSGHGIDGLLGRDVLAQGLFIYHGETSTFTLAF
ncbi:MAG: hypothetical protein QM811_17935 [Pirellulales bacterium]